MYNKFDTVKDKDRLYKYLAEFKNSKLDGKDSKLDEAESVYDKENMPILRFIELDGKELRSEPFMVGNNMHLYEIDYIADLKQYRLMQTNLYNGLDNVLFITDTLQNVFKWITENRNVKPMLPNLIRYVNRNGEQVTFEDLKKQVYGEIARLIDNGEEVPENLRDERLKLNVTSIVEDIVHYERVGVEPDAYSYSKGSYQNIYEFFVHKLFNCLR